MLSSDINEVHFRMHRANAVDYLATKGPSP